MAKKMYIGINNLATQVKKMYVGVNGVAKKVKKGYVGVGNIARMFFGGGSSGLRVVDTTLDYTRPAAQGISCGNTALFVGGYSTTNRTADSRYLRYDSELVQSALSYPSGRKSGAFTKGDYFNSCACCFGGFLTTSASGETANATAISDSDTFTALTAMSKERNTGFVCAMEDYIIVGPAIRYTDCYDDSFTKITVGAITPSASLDSYSNSTTNGIAADLSGDVVFITSDFYSSSDHRVLIGKYSSDLTLSFISNAYFPSSQERAVYGTRLGDKLLCHLLLSSSEWHTVDNNLTDVLLSGFGLPNRVSDNQRSAITLEDLAIFGPGGGDYYNNAGGTERTGIVDYVNEEFTYQTLSDILSERGQCYAACVNDYVLFGAGLTTGYSSVFVTDGVQLVEA